MNSASPEHAMQSDPAPILVVNDREDQLLATSAMLESLGAEIVTAASGPEALRQMLRREFAVMLLDVNLPGMDGFEIAAAVRQRPRSTLTPIIFVSASHQGDFDRLRGYETGAFDYVSVPIEPAILRAKVAAFLKMHRMHMEIRRQAEHLADLNRQLLHSNTALTELQRSKDLLTGMVIHDLRNPLTACLGNLDLAVHQADKNGLPVSKYLTSASESCLHLLEMINSMVDIMRMEDGKMPTRLELVDLDALIAGKVEQYRGAATAGKVSLVRMDGGPVGSFTTDGALLGRVVDNLLVNAIKHTPPRGHITIAAGRVQEDGLTIAIIDTGEGISSEGMANLFQKYGRVEGQDLGRKYDSGLGLVFCRMAVELLHGTISVASEPGRGTTFTLVFPASGDERPEARARS
jgi:signal transduction histidine kinase